MGCLRSIGCLAILAIAAGAAWLYRADWEPAAKRAVSGVLSSPEQSAAIHWEPISAEGSSRARAAVEGLGAKTGPVFANVAPADLASYVFDALTRELPPSASNVEAAAIGEQLAMRADVRLADFGGLSSLGPLARMLGEREPVQFTGTLAITQPGLAEFRVSTLRIKDVTVPQAMIPKLMQSMGRGPRPAGASPNALAFAVPAYIADVRVHDGKITLYKTVP